MSSVFLPKRKIQMLLLGLILIASSITGSLPAAQAQTAAPALFSDADNAAVDMTWDQPFYVTRSRYVQVNTALLIGEYRTMQDLKANSNIGLNLFGDTHYTGVITQVKKTSTGYFWVGKLKEKKGGYFYMLTYKNVFIAHIASASGGVYEVSWVGDGLYRVIQIDQSNFVDEPEGTVMEQMSTPQDLLQSGDLGATADSENQIDIMVVYTPAARAAEGGTTAMKARIALGLLETNTSYANAGITTRLRLVHVQEVSYTESGYLETDKERLYGTSDGYMDNVHTLRNTYAADMVGLIVNSAIDPNACGIAKAIMATASTAFMVTKRSCSTGYYSFGHEFGHLQGARHDVYVDSSTSPYTYGHGYVHTGSTAATRWRTVMAYSNKCAALGYTCTRLQYWSNPSKTYGGASMGDITAKNYLVLNATDYTVANFRTANISQNFSSSFNNSSAGWTSVYGTWGLSSSAYYKTLGVPNYWSSSKAGSFGDVTFEAKLWRYGCTTCANKLIVRGNPFSLSSGKDWNSSYAFQYSRAGSFSVYKYSSTGTPTTLKAWTSHAAILAGDHWNTLKVVAVGSALKFYINGALVWSGTDSTFATGTVGISAYMDTSVGNILYADSASASTTATEDINPNEEVVPGVEMGGDDPNQSP